VVGWLLLGMALAKECELRNCLPPDDTQDPPICFQKTIQVGLRPGAQSYRTCPSSAPYCEYCSAEPPCESVCQKEVPTKRPLGGECYYDQDCDGTFSRCLSRVCRRALLTFQACDINSPNDVCVTGQKSCFRGRCQGLKEGELCLPRSEGMDIECNPGWYCFLGLCTAQLPAGHTCTGYHPHECVSGFQCNLGAETPRCTEEYSLNIGEISSKGVLCRTNHVDPRVEECATMPALEMKNNEYVVSGRDCSEDTDCPRADTSFGECACKKWWEGQGLSGFCELAVPDPSRPAYKVYWEASIRLCHHDWEDDRCALETDMVEVLADVRTSKESISVDPTQVKTCAKDLIPEAFVETGKACRLPLTGMIVAISCLTFTSV